MALAAAYAICSLSYGELCSTIFGSSRFLELPLAALPLSDALPPPNYFCIDTGVLLFIPLDGYLTFNASPLRPTGKQIRGPPHSIRRGGKMEVYRNRQTTRNFF